MEQARTVAPHTPQNRVLASAFTILAVRSNTATLSRAGFGVGTRIEAVAQIAVLGLSMTLSPLVSQNAGAGQLERVRRAIFGCFAFVLAWQLLVWLVLQGLAPGIVAGYAEREAVGEVLRTFLWLVPLGLGAQGVVILAVSSCNALHRPARAMRLSVTRLFLLLVPLAWLGGRLAGTTGVFAGMLAANGLMAIVAWWQVRRLLREVATRGEAAELTTTKG